MEDFRVILETGIGPDDPRVLKERLRFSRLFAAHTAAEAAYFQVSAGYRGSQKIGLADEYRQRIGSLRQAYSIHVGRWTPAALRDDWRGYRGAVAGLRDRFLSLMAWEEQNFS